MRAGASENLCATHVTVLLRAGRFLYSTGCRQINTVGVYDTKTGW